jgi:hypothetical protein
MSEYKRTDAAFWIDTDTEQVVWEVSDCNFYVVRNGEMRIRDLVGEEIIRYTDQLLNLEILDDEALIDFEEQGKIEVINNAWFEVWNKVDSYWFSDPYFDIYEAIEYARIATLEEEGVCAEGATA